MATIETVHIHLPFQAQASTEWIPALSIPRRDIERLTLRPLKWLRFATFTVCGAKGHFSVTPGGDIVDYENVSFDHLADKYYYIPDDMYHLVDYRALDDACTSSAVTPRRSSFRQDVYSRDHSCVITGTRSRACHAAHIIPHSKGNDYITYVVRDRAGLYEQPPFILEEDVEIDCVENGMLLREDVHGAFGRGEIAFLKTPNFAMVPADVPQIDQGPIPDNRTTLQYMEPPTGRGVFLQWDVQADWPDEVHPPPSILLDFMYGVAVAKNWKCDGLGYMLKKRFEDDFKKVLKRPKRSAPEDYNSESAAESDDPKDPDYLPPMGKTGREYSDASAEMLETMDDLLLLSMLLKGTTPRSMAAEREKRNKEKELRSQEHSSEKVQRWLNSDASTRPL